jgi:site-specific DNA-cytosine methylase
MSSSPLESLCSRNYSFGIEDGVETLVISVSSSDPKIVYKTGDYAYLDELPFEPLMEHPVRLAELLQNNDIQKKKVVKIEGIRATLQESDETDEQKEMVEVKLVRFCRGTEIEASLAVPRDKTGVPLGSAKCNDLLAERMLFCNSYDACGGPWSDWQDASLLSLRGRPNVRHEPLPKRDGPTSKEWREQHSAREQKISAFLEECTEHFYYTHTVVVLAGSSGKHHGDIAFVDEDLEDSTWKIAGPVHIGNVFCGSGGMAAGVELANRGFRIGTKSSKPLQLSWACDIGENQIRSFLCNHGAGVHLLHGCVRSVVAALSTVDNKLKREAHDALLSTDLLTLEPPCQNYSKKNRSTDPSRFSDDHANISALWDGLDLWSAILPVGLNVENVEGINQFKSQPKESSQRSPLLGRVLGKLLLKGANVQLSAKEATAECGVGSGRYRMVLQATLGIQLPEQHVCVAVVPGSGIWEYMEEPHKNRYMYWRPNDGNVVSVDDVNGKPGSPPWIKRKRHYVGDLCHCMDGKRSYLAKIVRVPEGKKRTYDIVYRSKGHAGLPENGVEMSRIKPRPLAENVHVPLGAADVAADLLTCPPIQRPTLGATCNGLAIARCKLQQSFETASSDDVYREVRAQLRDTGGLVEHEVAQMYTFESCSDIMYKYKTEDQQGRVRLKVFSLQLPAPTVTSTMDILDKHYGIIRRGVSPGEVTPNRGAVTGPSLAEAKRFQGLPDSWILCGETLHDKMEMVADAVPPPFAFRLLQTWGRRLLGEQRYTWPGKLLHEHDGQRKYDEYLSYFLGDDNKYREQRKRRWDLWREGQQTELTNLETYHRLDCEVNTSLAADNQQDRRVNRPRSSRTIQAVQKDTLNREEARKEGFVLVSTRSTVPSRGGNGAKKQMQMRMPLIDASIVGVNIEFRYKEGLFTGEVLQVSDGSGVHAFGAQNFRKGVVPKGFAEILYEDGDRDWVWLRGPPFFNCASAIQGTWAICTDED